MGGYMAQQRIVTLSLTNEDMIRIADSIFTWDKLWTAIGYLSTWNLSYQTVAIYCDSGVDLVAVYHKEKQEQPYVIGAVWNGTDYGYHS